MLNPGRLQNAVALRRFRPWFRVSRAVPARVPVESRADREQEAREQEEIAAMFRVLQEIVECLQRATSALDGSIRRMDEALADIAEQKKQTEVLRREMGIGR